VTAASWSRSAACKGRATREHDPWHPDAGRANRYLYAEARAVCATCPVIGQCRDRGLDLIELTGEVEGMFGGLTPAELRQLARQLGRPTRKVAAHGTPSGYVAGCRQACCRDANARYKAGRRLAA
jgi:WhiB family redox-sensing transcriptional regulator